MPTDTNLAVVVHGAHDIRVEERPMPEPAPGQVRVAVHLGGICGSDLSYYRKGAVGDFTVTSPMILGHEIVGRVDDSGSAVGSAAPERVAVDPSSPCGRCDRCLEGRSNVCERPHFLGSASTTPHVDGGFASFVTTRTQNLVALPDHLTDELAVFAEPLAVSVHALHRAGPIAGRRLLVVGAGPIGAMIVATARAMGAGEIVATDLDPARLARAAQVGASATRVVGQDDLGTDYDAVLDASGAEPAIADGLTRVRRGGVFVLVGLPHGGPLPIPLALAVPREIDLRGSFRFNHDEFVTAVDLLADGLDLGPLRTGCHHATAAPEAFVEAVEPSSMKVQLDFSAG